MFFHSDPPGSIQTTSTQIHPTQIHLDPPYVRSLSHVPLVYTYIYTYTNIYMYVRIPGSRTSPLTNQPTTGQTKHVLLLQGRVCPVCIHLYIGPPVAAPRVAVHGVPLPHGDDMELCVL